MGNSKYQVTKSVCLNEKNEKDKKILKHVSRRNFSGYVKKLILEDIKKREEEKVENKQIEQKPNKQKIKKHNTSINSPLINLPNKTT